MVADDPCAEEHLSTDFSIGASRGAASSVYHKSDYAFTQRNLLFKVDKDCFDYYEFQIGSAVYNQSSNLVYFNQYDTVKNLPVTLITKKEDVVCPDYVGVDTVVRYLNTYDKCDWTMLGSFRGVTDEFPLDSFDITISNAFLINGNCNSFRINNFNNNGCLSAWSFYDFSYTKGIFSGVSCGGGSGRYLFDPVEETLSLVYVINPAPTYIDSDTIIFKGKKI
jgi:hypothetical protein